MRLSSKLSPCLRLLPSLLPSLPLFVPFSFANGLTSTFSAYSNSTGCKIPSGSFGQGYVVLSSFQLGEQSFLF